MGLASFIGAPLFQVRATKRASVTKGMALLNDKDKRHLQLSGFVCLEKKMPM